MLYLLFYLLFSHVYFNRLCLEWGFDQTRSMPFCAFHTYSLLNYSFIAHSTCIYWFPLLFQISDWYLENIFVFYTCIYEFSLHVFIICHFEYQTFPHNWNLFVLCHSILFFNRLFITTRAFYKKSEFFKSEPPTLVLYTFLEVACSRLFFLIFQADLISPIFDMLKL